MTSHKKTKQSYALSTLIECAVYSLICTVLLYFPPITRVFAVLSFVFYVTLFPFTIIIVLKGQQRSWWGWLTVFATMCVLCPLALLFCGTPYFLDLGAKSSLLHSMVVGGIWLILLVVVVRLLILVLRYVGHTDNDA
jgi:hypothetical protein